MTEEEPEGEFSQQKFVYCGERRKADGKAVHEWVLLEHVNDDNAGLWYKKNLVSAPMIGGIYELSTLPGGKSVKGDGLYVGKFEDDDQRVLSWRMKDAVSRTERVAGSKARKAKKEDRGFADYTLGQMAKLYQREMSQINRNAILSIVVGAVTSTRVDNHADDV